MRAATISGMDALASIDSFSCAWRCVGAAGDAAAVASQLLAAYAEPQRKYHTQQHLGECLALWAPLRHLAGRPDEIELALWFHDAVYELQGHENEAKSAGWARSALLAAGASAAVAQRVHDLVMATCHAAMPQQVDEQLLVDVDLAILGAQQARFAEYESQIRAEYAHVPGDLFESKRREILQGFLDRPRIYGSPHFQSLLEMRARSNLQRAVSAVPRATR